MIRNKDSKIESHIKFIEYTGEYPNLCRGVLTLEIDGEIVKFGHDYKGFESWKTDGNYDSFWCSGGSVGFTDNWTNSYVECGEWEIDVNEIPEEYRKYAEEIDEVFNNNVDWGCCGGCL